MCSVVCEPCTDYIWGLSVTSDISDGRSLTIKGGYIDHFCLQMFGDLARILVAVPRLEFLPPDRVLSDAARYGRLSGAVVSLSPGLISGSAPS